MKRTSIFFLPMFILCFAVLLSSCGGQDEEDVETNLSAIDIAERIIDSQEDMPDLMVLIPEEGEFADYLSAFYRIEEGLVEEGAICYAGGINAHEIAVFKLKDNSEAEFARTLLMDYVDSRTGDFVGYIPEQVPLLEQAEVVSSGAYIALLICEDTEAAKLAFESCFEAADQVSGVEGEDGNGEEAGEGTTDARGEGADDADSSRQESQQGDISGANGASQNSNGISRSQNAAYDAKAVLNAYRTGDASNLSSKNKSILDTCTRVINQVIKDGMSDYEKELAVHDWIIQWTDYDEGEISHEAGVKPDPDNDNPYGLLISRKAICSGYTSTFQLFMDMLEIQCITVNGTAHGGESAHAWNMVNLDGDWYCVDVTWDDPVGTWEYDNTVKHMYFNVTSEMLRNNDHQWDESKVPEASSFTYQWRP